MIINGKHLLAKKPILNMETSKISHPNGSYGLTEVGYDIRLKQDIRFFMNLDGPVVAIREPGKPIGFHQGRFCLASAIEKFNMPEDLMAVGHDKSTWARHGVQVFNTIVEPGWRGFLTLELVFNGNEPVHIPAGTGIMQLIFHRPLNTAKYVGKYQDQTDEPVPPR